MDNDALFLFGGFILGFIYACFLNRPLVRKLGRWIQSYLVKETTK